MPRLNTAQYQSLEYCNQSLKDSQEALEALKMESQSADLTASQREEIANNIRFHNLEIQSCQTWIENYKPKKQKVSENPLVIETHAKWKEAVRINKQWEEEFVNRQTELNKQKSDTLKLCREHIYKCNMEWKQAKLAAENNS